MVLLSILMGRESLPPGGLISATAVQFCRISCLEQQFIEYTPRLRILTDDHSVSSRTYLLLIQSLWLVRVAGDEGRRVMQLIQNVQNVRKAIQAGDFGKRVTKNSKKHSAVKCSAINSPTTNS